MQSQPSSSTRIHDIPKPETGLAEWTSKIKAMQRQVDADEEAEQKMLEEEIAASRLARLRRSHGLGHGGFTDGLDMCKYLYMSSCQIGKLFISCFIHAQPKYKASRMAMTR